ncbi:MAG: cyclopropane-fatty-acyl-phospholipid synthase family protein, partial [Pseudomonadota bacterium]|nr:cyclopropane-fatty-acyl-phospholipid synthase family protein [Pseudomonadota bacterium]
MQKISLEGKPNLPRWFSGVSLILNNLRFGELTLVLPNKRSFQFTGSLKGPKGCIIVKNEEFFSRLVREGDNGFSESYMDGWWDTPDLMAVLDVILMNNNEIGRSFPGGFIFRNYERLLHWWRSNSKTQAKKNIFYHYDLGNEFYAKWLDKTMTYSSAIFTTGAESLEKAQENKYKAICDSINSKPGDHILEIGCGWGGFMEYAIKKRQVMVTGLTISKAQQDFTKKRLFEEGLSDRAKILLKDYRNETGKYDGVVSIEMFEAVGEKYWPLYFRSMQNFMKNGAHSALQIITIADELFPEYRKRVDFIQKYIFPGG